MEDKMEEVKKEEVKFHDLVKEIGWALAAKLANTLLGDEFWNNITFSDCFSIFHSWRDRWEATPATSITMKTALLKASKKAKTLDEWLEVYSEVHYYTTLYYRKIEDPELKETEKLSLKMLAKKVKPITAKTFDEYRELYEKLCSKHVPYASEPMQIITRKMAKKAETFQEYYQVYEGLSDDSKLKETILNKMVNKAKNFREWYEVYTVAPPGSKLKEIAFYNLKEKSEELKKFERWYEIYCDEPELKELALKMMFTTANTFNDWFKVYTLAPYGSNERVTAFNKLLEKPQSFNDWRDFYTRFAKIDDEVMMKKAAEKMAQKAETYEEWFETLKRTPRGSELRETALYKLTEKAKTFEEWAKIYEILPSNHEIKEIALMKIANEVELPFETWEYICRSPGVFEMFSQIEIDEKIINIALKKIKSSPDNLGWIEMYADTFKYNYFRPNNPEFHKMAEEELRRRIKITFD